jgi:hypothetical protein
MRSYLSTGDRRFRPDLSGPRARVTLLAVALACAAAAVLMSAGSPSFVRFALVAVTALTGLAVGAEWLTLRRSSPPSRPAVAPDPGAVAPEPSTRVLRLYVRTLEATLEAQSEDFATMRDDFEKRRDEVRTEELQLVADAVRALREPAGAGTEPATERTLARVDAAIRRLGTPWSFDRPPLTAAARPRISEPT